VVVDDIEFGTGGRWGQWSDGGGSSLELVDARSDNRLGPNWRDSDETGKAPWTNIEVTGLLDNGGDPPSALHVMMLEEGECLLDNVEVFVAPAGANLVSNATFESGTNGWISRGNHVRSSLENEGNSSRSLHIRAGSQGDIGANKIFFNVASRPPARPRPFGPKCAGCAAGRRFCCDSGKLARSDRSNAPPAQPWHSGRAEQPRGRQCRAGRRRCHAHTCCSRRQSANRSQRVCRMSMVSPRWR
jgi:hypothetical protein